MGDAMRRIALVAAAMLTLVACTDGGGSTPSPQHAPPVTSGGADAGQTTSTADKQYTALAAPCAAIDGRTGTKLPSSRDTAATDTARCTYGEQPGKVEVTSSATIAKGNAPDQATEALYDAAVAKANTQRVDGVATKPHDGLGDEAVVVTRFEDHTTALFVRSGNALIQASATIPPQMDRESEVLQLQRQEPVLTELAQSLLAQLR